MDVVKLDIDINFLGNLAELALKVSLEIMMVIWGVGFASYGSNFFSRTFSLET
jgi:hypothetical protein